MCNAIIRKITFLFIFFISLYSQSIEAQLVPLQYKQNKSFTYDETIQYYRLLDQKYKHATLLEQGITDIGKPLHLFVMYGGKNFKKDVIDAKKVPILLVMNGIHPGEPDGVDASLLWAEWILSNNDSLLKNTCICIIPIYNIDGCLNRNCCSRANQDGPEQYGFRGNSKNLDLNRDFIKMDSRNAESFVRIFQWLQPDMFIDTHVSDGADYQYTFTLLTTQKNKLEKNVSDLLYSKILPAAENYMLSEGWPVAPYVNGFAEVPDSGLVAFYDSPRYSTGYAALFNVPGFVLETHMLKPFPKRVESTLAFLKFASTYIHQQGAELKRIKREADVLTASAKSFGLNWKLDKSKLSWFDFLGYEAGFKKSEVTGKDRLYYDTQRPYKKSIPMYWEYVCTDIATKPFCYIIPQGWYTIIDKLKCNNVGITYLTTDSVVKVETYKIVSYQSTAIPYEGHHVKRNIKISPVNVEKKFYKGDAIIKTGTRFDYFLASVLEPTSVDSYFTWGFFDSMLQQKEWFSDYIWEDKAMELLNSNDDLNVKFIEKLKSDTGFANDSWQQLYFIYTESPYFEESYMQYPVYKLFK